MLFRQMYESDESAEVSFYYWAVFEDVNSPGLDPVLKNRMGSVSDIQGFSFSSPYCFWF